MSRQLNLAPVHRVRPQQVFAKREEYEQFRITFAESVRPKLEHYRIARQRSEERAKRHMVG